MGRLIDKYAAKLVAAGLAAPGAPLVGMLDADAEWNREDPLVPVLNRVFQRLSLSALLYCRPAAPYDEIIDALAGDADGGAIRPRDTETRTFIHDLPVAPSLDEATVVAALKRRKSLIVPGMGVVTGGSVSPEQAYIVFSSVCFAAFVKFFSDAIQAARAGTLTPRRLTMASRILSELPPILDADPLDWCRGPFTSPEAVYRAMTQAGRRTVSHGLVDSFFGNISCRLNAVVYVSQTGSSLDELAGCIDPCPMDGSSCAAVTASSELSAHRDIYLRTGCRTILHGHPRFAVVASMDCDEIDCPAGGDCHRRCPKPRAAAGVPVVSGEVGTGRYGLCHTVPPALSRAPGVIVYGHGVFTTGAVDFREPFDTLVDIERRCRDIVRKRLTTLTDGRI